MAQEETNKLIVKYLGSKFTKKIESVGLLQNHKIPLPVMIDGMEG